LKAIAFMGVGTLGGIAGRKVIAKGVEAVTKDEEQKDVS
jgi:F0F1-type ATP synthase membrane subunit c/vacuolar-type H+-ATPase subunit K